MYRLSYDGTIVDEPEFLVMGGQAEALTAELRNSYQAGLPLAEAIGVACRALGSVGGTNGTPRGLPAAQLEVAVLDRTRPNRKFRRIAGAALTALLPPPEDGQAVNPPAEDVPPGDGSETPDGESSGSTPEKDT
jgi:proteasome alpha subunit